MSVVYFHIRHLAKFVMDANNKSINNNNNNSNQYHSLNAEKKQPVSHMMIKVINHKNHRFKAIKFNMMRCAKVKHSYKQRLDDINTEGITIEVYEKGLFRYEKVASTKFCPRDFPVDKITKNDLLLDSNDMNTIYVMRILIQLSRATRPYKAEIAPSRLPQVDLIYMLNNFGRDEFCSLANDSSNDFSDDDCFCDVDTSLLVNY